MSVASHMRNSLLVAMLVGLSGSVHAVTEARAEAPKSASQAAEAWTEDGLKRVTIEGVDAAFARPGSSLSVYDKVQLLPPSVAFRRDWGRSSGTMTGRVRAEDAQAIKDRLAQLLTQELAREFKEGGYELSDQPGDDVLAVEVRIVDLNIVAPDVPSMSRKEVYAVSAGQMSLVAELRDSASGESVLRVFDHEKGETSVQMRRITRMDNVQEATRLASGWARTLRQQLDAAHAHSTD